MLLKWKNNGAQSSQKIKKNYIYVYLLAEIYLTEGLEDKIEDIQKKFLDG